MDESETRDMSHDNESDDSTIENTLDSADPLLDDNPTQIGPYKILAKLGEGGFGVVYEAQQEEPVKRRVALKIIKPGMDSKKVIARFEAERQALALMTHQNIAKVLGGGLTDLGLPYFVMELVKGEPITDFCDRNKMTLDDRLKLLIPVCHAVQHAHAKAVIHRDIKPSNILVGYNAQGHPSPTVIDFGVSKALNQQLTEKTIYTQEGQMIGTPEYMSPEQAEMSGVDIDTRTDVYSLGVVLYELLTGMLPFEPSELRGKMFGELQRLIREQIPPRPSNRLNSALSTMNMRGNAVEAAKKRHMSETELPKHLRGELDWVVMKCLEKDRDRRYPTPIALAEEIQHYLNNEPVLARPPSASYRFSKLIKRNKLPVASILIFATTLLIATAVSVRFSMIADSERERALTALSDRDTALKETLEQANELELVVDFQSKQLGQINPEWMGIQIRRSLIDATESTHRTQVESNLSGINFTDIALDTLDKNIFSETIDAINEQFKDQPLIQARMQQTFSIIALDLGLYNLAEPPQTKALQTRRRILGNTHPLTLQSVHTMANFYAAIGKSNQANTLYHEALQGFRDTLGNEHLFTMTTMTSLAKLLQTQNKLADAEILFTESLKLHRKTLGNNHPSTLTTTGLIGSLLQIQGKFPEAEAHFRMAIDGFRNTLGDNHTNTLYMINMMGTLKLSQFKFQDAEPYFLKTLKGYRKTYGSSHPKTLISMNNLGHLYFNQGKYDLAEPLMVESLKVLRHTQGTDHPTTLISLGNVGSLLMAQNKLQEAEPYLHDALEVSKKTLGNHHRETLRAISNMGYLLDIQDKFDQAEPYYRQALAGRRAAFGNMDPDTIDSAGNLGFLLNLQNKYNEAEPYFAEALEGRRTLYGNNNIYTRKTIKNLSRVYLNLNRFNESEALATELYKLQLNLQGTNHPDTVEALQLLINLYTQWHKANPTANHDTKATQWQAKLDALNTESEVESKTESIPTTP